MNVGKITFMNVGKLHHQAGPGQLLTTARCLHHVPGESCMQRPVPVLNAADGPPQDFALAFVTDTGWSKHKKILDFLSAYGGRQETKVCYCKGQGSNILPWLATLGPEIAVAQKHETLLVGLERLAGIRLDILQICLCTLQVPGGEPRKDVLDGLEVSRRLFLARVEAVEDQPLVHTRQRLRHEQEGLVALHAALLLLLGLHVARGINAAFCVWLVGVITRATMASRVRSFSEG